MAGVIHIKEFRGFVRGNFVSEVLFGGFVLPQNGIF